MKKLIALLLALLLLLSQGLAWAEETDGEESSALTVGNPTRMKGDFFTEMWGNATSDIDVRDLLHGYDLVRWVGDTGEFAVDPSVVSSWETAENAAGDKTYRFTLQDDLYYSDGSKITAWDYAFSILLQISPEIAELDAVPAHKEQLLGCGAYLNGTASALSGVRVISDSVLEITLDHAYLPFFYEVGLLSCNPYPIAVIAPGVAVRDDGSGVYLANADPAVQEPVFTAELLRQTVLDPETGYRSHPSVVSGPYTLTSWDGLTAEFDLNPSYKGNWEGVKPTIAHLTYTLAENDTMIQKLENGEFGLLDKVMEKGAVLGGMTLAGGGVYTMAEEARLGLSYISFCCEKPALASQAVRQALAWCMDREAIMKDYTGDFGIRADGFYGAGQWMYGIVSGAREIPLKPPKNPSDPAEVAAYVAELKKWDEVTLDGLTEYAVDVALAKSLLERDGWTLNAEGLREKAIGGETVTLDLTLYYPAGNRIAACFEAYWLPNLEEAGIRVTLVPVDMTELLNQYYKLDGREMDMVYLASNFLLVFDPALYFKTGAADEPIWSFTNNADEELYNLAVKMRQTQPGDLLEYMLRWVAFQKRFNTSLPMLPIYSNIYFDFYISDLQNFNIPEATTWGKAIVPATLGGAPETEP